MLGQKEICGLIFVLGCYLVHSAPSTSRSTCSECLECLQIEAKELENAVNNFVSISSNVEYDYSIFPRSNGSQKEMKDIVMAYHTLFGELSKTIDGAEELKSLQENLKQQSACLYFWNVTKSSITIPNKEKEHTGRKILLVKASEHYNKFMQKF